MNEGWNADPPVNNGLQRFSPYVRNNFGKDFALRLQIPQMPVLPPGCATAFAFDTPALIVAIDRLRFT
jgi:hypothetical protein